MEHNKRKMGLLECFALFVYVAAHLGMAVVHEPWFDEAQAWQIARSASLFTILFETPHYEGHPPLWHLVLMPFAKGGAPYELSLTLVSLSFMGTAVYLLLRYAPFPRPVRLLLPFTYFWFYQYGVISRAYCMMALEFVLLAVFYKDRNKRPGRYTVTLMLLCATSAYGIVIAGGLAALWLWEILKEAETWRSVFKNLRGYAKDWRIRWLAALLLLAVCVVLQIMPRKDTFATALMDDIEDIPTPFGVRLLYTFLILPAEVTVTDIYNNYSLLYNAYMSLSNILSGCFLGIIIWILLLYYARKTHTICLCVLPYAVFALFSAKVYMCNHHIGIGLLYFCFWAWASMEQGGDRLQEAKSQTEGEKAVHILTVLMGVLAMGFSLYWTAAACVQDIEKNYWSGRNTAKFIREYHLEQYRIMREWDITRDSAGNVIKQDVNYGIDAFSIAPYFEHNLFFNLNDGRDDRNYATHILLSEEETKSCLDRWREDGPPQVLLGNPELEIVYGDAVSKKDYALVYRESVERVWKAGSGTDNYFEVHIYLRRDLLKETGLQEISE